MQNINIEEKLNNYKKSNNKNYQNMAKYLLNYKGDFNHLTISKISEDLYVSSAVPTRFAQEIGLSGFNELKILLKNNQFDEKDSIIHYMDRTLNFYKDDVNIAIQNTFELNSPRQITDVVSNFINAEKINFFAVGGSYFYSLDFIYKIQRLGFNVIFNSDRHIQYVHAKNTTKNDLAIGISYSGKTKEVLKALDIAKSNGCKTILITSCLSFSENKYDKILHVDNREFSNRYFSIISKISIVSLLDIIYIQLLNQNYKEYYKILKATKYEDY